MPSSRFTRSCSTPTVPDDPYLGRELGRYFPTEIGESVPRRLAAASTAARDHRHATHQFDDQPRRRYADACASPTRPARRPASIAAAFAAVRDSYGMIALNGEIDALDNKVAGKTQLDALRRGAGSAARPHGLVPAQCRSAPGARGHRRALSRRHRRRWRRRSTARYRRRRWPRALPRRPSWRRPACRRRWRSASPTCRRSRPRPTSCWWRIAPA